MGKIYDNLELIGARLLVRPLPDLDVTASGFVIPEQSRHQQNRAIVEKVGPGELVSLGSTGPIDTEGFFKPIPIEARRPMSLLPGDLVLYQKFAGTWVTLDEQQRLMLLEDEIQGRIPAQFITLVQHDDSEHLEGEPCLICSAPKHAEAKQWLEEERARLVAAGSSPSGS